MTASNLNNLFFPIADAFAFDVIAGFFQMPCYFAPVLFVAHFEKHFDSDSAQRREPHRAAMINFDDIGAGFRDVIQKISEHSRTV